MTKGKKWVKATDMAATDSPPLSEYVHDEEQERFENSFVSGGRVGSSRQH